MLRSIIGAGSTSNNASDPAGSAPRTGRRRARAVTAGGLLATALTFLVVSSAAVLATGQPAAAAPGGTSPAPPVQCVGNGTDGNRIQVLYTFEPGNNHFAEREPAIRQAVWEAQQNVNDSARRDGGQRWLRYLTGATGCQVIITQVQVPAGTSGGDSDGTFAALRNLNFTATNRLYAGYVENGTFCGLTENALVGDDSTPGTNNLHNTRSNFAIVAGRCWSGHTLTHEFAHALGGLLSGAPNNDGTGHCTDGYETLCQPGTGALACPDPMNVRLLDCGGNDYFAVVPRGTYLPTHFNAALHSLYLSAGTAVTPLTTVPPLPSQVIRALDVQGTSVALSFRPPGWPGVHPDLPPTQYQILRNGTVVATVTGTSHATTALITGLTTNTSSTFTMRTVVTINGVNRTSVSSQPLAVTTNSSTTLAGAPATGRSFIFTNGVLDPGGAFLAMDDGFSSLAEGNPILQYPRNVDGDNQRWLTTTAAGGTFTLTNRLSGKCLTVQGAVTTPGAALVQSTCTGSTGQRWSFTSLATGVYSIRSALGTNLCVQSAGASTAALTGLVTGACSTSEPTQRWSPNLIG
jgi:hypothetical protein